MSLIKRSYTGDLNFGSALKVNKIGPLDNRLVVEEYSDLLNVATWQVGGNYYIYKGIIVSVINDSDSSKNGVYEYIGNSNSIDETNGLVNGSNWKNISQGGQISVNSDGNGGYNIGQNGNTYNISFADRVVSSGKIISVSPKVKSGLNAEERIQVEGTNYYITSYQVNALNESINNYRYIYENNNDGSFYIIDELYIDENTSTDENTNETVTTYSLNTSKLILFITEKNEINTTDRFKYLKLNIVEDPDNPIYINVKDLVDVYTANNPYVNDVTVTIDNNNLISALIKNGSVGSNKLVQTVQDSLGLANNSVQGVSTSTSSTDDTIETDNNNKVIKTTGGSGTVTLGTDTYSGSILTTTKFVKDYVENNSTLYWEEPDASN